MKDSPDVICSANEELSKPNPTITTDGCRIAAKIMAVPTVQGIKPNPVSFTLGDGQDHEGYMNEPLKQSNKDKYEIYVATYTIISTGALEVPVYMVDQPVQLKGRKRMDMN